MDTSNPIARYAGTLELPIREEHESNVMARSVGVCKQWEAGKRCPVFPRDSLRKSTAIRVRGGEEHTTTLVEVHGIPVKAENAASTIQAP
jgi:hypothetical protein